MNLCLQAITARLRWLVNIDSKLKLYNIIQRVNLWETGVSMNVNL